MITIRELTEKDYPAVLPLWQEELDNRWATAENLGKHYNRVKDDENYKTFVAVLDGELVGFVSTVRAFSVGLKNGYMHIQGLAVKKDWQNHGIGTKLLRHTEEYARSLGLHSILLNSGVKRTAAHGFYKRCGYSKDSWCFDKAL